MLPRSYLYIPGDDERKLAGAGRRMADAVIVDLEDAVSEAARPLARRRARSAVSTLAGPPRRQLWTRVNPPPAMTTDIEAVAVPGLTGVVVAKAEPASLAEADRLLADAEDRHDLAAGTFSVIALIETASGLLDAPLAARAPRVVRLGLGEADLIAELGLQPGPDRSELAALRLRLVIASAAAGIAAPVGPVETHLGDEQRLRESTRVLKALGFRARTALHPRQVPVINDSFTPTDEEVDQARQTVAALADAAVLGSGVALTAQRRFVDTAVARSARQTLATHEAIMRHNEQARDPTRAETGVNGPPGAGPGRNGDEVEER